MSSNKNILEQDTEFNLSDYSKFKLAQSYKKLYETGILENKNRKTEKYDKRVYNLSFKDLFNNFFVVCTKILNELTELIHDDKENKTFRNYMIIFSKDDRLVYVGVGLILFSLIIYFISTTT